jgi:hypothetical protein
MIQRSAIRLENTSEPTRRITLSRNRVQEHGFKAEDRFASRFSLTLVPGSGSGWKKGDCYDDTHLYSLKATKRTFFRLLNSHCIEVVEAAMQKNLTPRVAVIFVTPGAPDTFLLFVRLQDLENVNKTLLPYIPQAGSLQVQRADILKGKHYEYRDLEGVVWLGIPHHGALRMLTGGKSPEQNEKDV